MMPLRQAADAEREDQRTVSSVGGYANWGGCFESEGQKICKNGRRYT